MRDSSVKEQFLNPSLDAEQENIYSDFPDGSVFKNIELFSQSPNSLKIILYQDAFEVSNPLGAARTKHKILAVYYSLGNLYPHNRSKIDTIQLALLIKEKALKNFGWDKVLSRLVQDLQDIEENGIDIEGIDEGNVKGTVVAMLGDNLGIHSIGGFIENFSTTEFMCRYCKISRDDMIEGNLNAYRDADRRTPEAYDAVTRRLEETRLPHMNGIKCNSVLNKLRYFHVCNPGLPPCLAYDLFEGVIQYDMAIYIQYFVREKHWFTYQQLNRSLKNIKLTGADSLDKFNKKT